MMGSPSRPRFGDILRWEIDGQVVMYVGPVDMATDYALALTDQDTIRPQGSIMKYGFTTQLTFDKVEFIERQGDAD